MSTHQEEGTSPRHDIDWLSNRRRAGYRRDGGVIPSRPWGIIGVSSAIVGILDLIERVGPTDVPVLITGESGVGKELVARAVHAVSALRQSVVVNCAGLPETLVESEMFGHVRGAFTGADRDKRGLLEAANGGTFILDEIGDLPLPSQAKFLRALQDGEVRRLGSDAVSHVDIRLISSTNKNLKLGIEESWFRPDLYWRINGMTIIVPPLRDRPEDIAPLAQHFLSRSLALEVVDLLMAYSWPGNVRELELELRVARALAGHREIRPDALREEIRSAGGASFGADGHHIPRPRTLHEVERAHIEQVVRNVGSNLSRAAKILGIDRGTLRRKVRTYGRNIGGSDSRA